MRLLFELSYWTLCLVVLAEAFLLRQLLSQAMWSKLLYLKSGRTAKAEGLAVGTPAPKFSAPVLGTGEIFQTEHLKGYRSILLFASLEEESFLLPDIQAGVAALWHKVRGRLHVVCVGTEETCDKLNGDDRATALRTHRIKIILDETGEIARTFRVSLTPQAVEVDQATRVIRYGQPDSSGHENGQWDSSLVPAHQGSNAVLAASRE